ncbi:MAG: 30S ribosomal protein S9 [Nanoarchaeota archaeon]|nr:30S ribosomal protein S9 [Nanoarchaeota archaeon]
MVRKQKVKPSGIHVSSKRKMAVARATLKKGKGVVRINSFNLNNFGTLLSRERIREALTLAKPFSDEVDIKISVQGGGWSAQSEAVRAVIAKTLVIYSKSDELKKKYLSYDRHLLVADTRRTEPQKPYRSAARKKRMTSKR